MPIRKSNGAAKWAALTGMMALTNSCTPPDLSGDQTLGAEDAAGQRVRIESGASPEPGRPRQIRQSRLDNAPVADPHAESPGRNIDLWVRMRRQFSIPRFHDTHTRRQIEWLQRNEDYLRKVAERARDNLPYIVREAERRGLPIELALLPVVESAFQPFAHSKSSGASGLWQFIPSTARLYGLRINWWYDGRRDLVAATSAAFDYLVKLNRDFGGDWLLTVAAYNWGEGNLRRTLARNRQSGKPLDFWSLRVPSETRAHVQRWLAICEIISRPNRYGVTLKQLPDEVGFRVVALEHQIDLALAAELAGLDLDGLRRLNPGYRRWATDPNRPNHLLIPTAGAETFARSVAMLAPRQRVAWVRHLVVSGDTLSEIASRYRTSVAVLKQINRLESSLIRAGDDLVVPAAASIAENDAVHLETRRQSQVAGKTATPPPRIHLVEKGENLWLISRRHGVSLNQLVAWNGLDPNASLRPGQRLGLRPEEKADTAFAPAPGVPKGKVEGDYVVRRGDNLWLIARRHAVSTDQIALWNRLSVDEVLRPGQTLRITPPNVGRPSTDSF